MKISFKNESVCGTHFRMNGFARSKAGQGWATQGMPCNKWRGLTSPERVNGALANIDGKHKYVRRCLLGIFVFFFSVI